MSPEELSQTRIIVLEKLAQIQFDLAALKARKKSLRNHAELLLGEAQNLTQQLQQSKLTVVPEIPVS